MSKTSTITQEKIKQLNKIENVVPNIGKIKGVDPDPISDSISGGVKSNKITQAKRSKMSSKEMMEGLKLLRSIKNDLSARTIEPDTISLFSKGKDYRFEPRVRQGIANYKKEVNRFNVK